MSLGCLGIQFISNDVAFMENITKTFLQAAVLTTGFCVGFAIVDAVANGHIEPSADITRGLFAGAMALSYIFWKNRGAQGPK